MAVTYTTLTLAEARAELDAVRAEAHAVFGRLTPAQLNWKPDERSWSVGQCFEHLLMANDTMLAHAMRAMEGAPPNVWQRLPWLPSLLGRLLISSQSPANLKKYTAPPSARPAASVVAADVVERFVSQTRQIVETLQDFDGRDGHDAVMRSPFVSFITYSVLDGWRLLAAHSRRHLEQARRVTQQPGFPAQ